MIGIISGLSFLGGAVITAFGYTLFITSKLSTLNQRFEDHLKSTGVCSFHNQVTSDAAVAKTQAEEVKRRLDRIDK